jgi:hypothetical protein
MFRADGAVNMAENDGDGGWNALLGVVASVLLIAVVALSFMVMNGGVGRQSAEFSIEAPQAPDAG